MGADKQKAQPETTTTGFLLADPFESYARGSRAHQGDSARDMPMKEQR
jgi:hypothetical protein